MPNITVNVVLSGNNYAVAKALSVLAWMEYLGCIGASRTVEFDWDGDGHERIRVQCDALDGPDSERMPMPDDAHKLKEQPGRKYVIRAWQHIGLSVKPVPTSGDRKL